jgi:hypothetical protein
MAESWQIIVTEHADVPVTALDLPAVAVFIEAMDEFDQALVLEDYGFSGTHELNVFVRGRLSDANRSAAKVLDAVLRHARGDVLMVWDWHTVIAERRGGVFRVSDAWRDDLQLPDTTA